MQSLEGRTVFSFLSNRKKITPIDGRLVRLSHLRRDGGILVSSYMDLVGKVAELSFRNPEFILVFRGQSGDWLNRAKNTSIKPKIFRPGPGRPGPTGLALLRSRYDMLDRAEQALIAAYETGGFIGLQRLQRYRILRWAILQHYEVCATPLLDVSHSLRVAASFASMDEARTGFLYVLALPHLGGSVTTSSEYGLQIMRLSSVCPPEALRPHFQEGYLLGKYPDLFSVEDQQHYHQHEIDFGQWLLCKFRLEPAEFWQSSDLVGTDRQPVPSRNSPNDPSGSPFPVQAGRGVTERDGRVARSTLPSLFPKVEKEALFPDARDRFFAVAQKIRAGLDKTDEVRQK